MSDKSNAYFLLRFIIIDNYYHEIVINVKVTWEFLIILRDFY